MTLEELIARHEAAHAVLAVLFAYGLYIGIDIDLLNKSGGTGAVGVRIADIDHTALSGEDLEAAIEEKAQEIRQSLHVILGGPAADAVYQGVDFASALDGQPSDKKKAYEFMSRAGITDKFADQLVASVGEETVARLKNSDVGDAVIALADRLLIVRRMDGPAFEAEAKKALMEAVERREAAGQVEPGKV